MPYCATCRQEYEEGIEKCTDCGETLFAGPIPSDLSSAAPEEKWAILMRVRDEESAEIIHGLLESEGLECEVVGRTAAEFPVPVVDSLSRLEIWVPESKLGEARAILNEAREGTTPCPACGHMSSAEEDKCEYCDAPLR